MVNIVAFASYLSGLGNSIANRQEGLTFRNERDKGWVSAEDEWFRERKE